MHRALSLIATLFITAGAAAATLTETIDRTFDVRPGALVSLSNVNGRIAVESWNQPRVRVVAHKQVKGDRKALEAVRVEMEPRDGGLRIVTQHPGRHSGSFIDWMFGNHGEASVRYEITVPRAMDLEIRNTNGSVQVSGVSGKTSLLTTNGKITVARLEGSIVARTTNGGIEAELLNVIQGQPLRFETTNGRIAVTVPPSLAADIEASTTNGSIQSELPITTTRFSKTSLKGTTNGGGTPVRLRTTNGGIRILTRGVS
jgi:hypothetical protein